jgi:hypothetical protein
MSIIQGSLQFLAENLVLSSTNMDSSTQNVRERSVRLQQYTIGQTLDKFEEENGKGQSFIASDIPSATASSSFPGNPSQKCKDDIGGSIGAAWPTSGNRISGPPLPELPGVDADYVKNLLMSWFYAGYYTAKAEDSAKR